jgi:hypothetical protein
MGRGVFTEDRWLLNPAGELIRLPGWVFTRLNRFGFLFWNRESKFWQIRPSIFGWMELWRLPDFRPDQKLKACDLEKPRTGTERLGCMSRMLRILGEGCEGIDHPSRFEIEALKADLDRTPEPRGPVSEAKAQEIVDEVRARNDRAGSKRLGGKPVGSKARRTAADDGRTGTRRRKKTPQDNQIPRP